MEKVVGAVSEMVSKPIDGLLEPVKDVLQPVTDVLKTQEDVKQENTAGLGSSTIMQSTNAIISTDAPTTMQTMPNATQGSGDDFLSCAYTVETSEENVSKMVQLTTNDWQTNDTQYKVLTRLSLPQVFFDNTSKPAYGQTRFFEYIRCGFHFRLMVNAATGCQGALVLTYMPGAMDVYFENDTTLRNLDNASLLNLPHAILDLRTSTEVSLVIPYISSDNYAKIRDQRTPVGQVVVWVLCPVSAGANTTLPVEYSLYGEMLDLDLQCPRAYNQGRKHPRRRLPSKPRPSNSEPRIIIEPGPGSANLGNGVINSRVESLALANEGTSVDHCTAGSRSSIVDLLEVLGRWQILGGESWSVDKNNGDQLWALDVNLTSQWVGTIRHICSRYGYWRGSLEFKVMVFGSNFTQGKYQLSWFRRDGSGSGFNYSDARNSLFVTGDISAAPATLVIPFSNRTWRLNTTADYGVLKMFVVNKLKVNVTAASTVQFVVFMRVGKDFQLTAPRCGSLKIKNQGNTDNQLANEEPVCFLNFVTANVPIQGASHTLCQTLFSRGWFYGNRQFTQHSAETFVIGVPTEGPGSLLSCFMYFSGEVQLTFANNSDNDNLYVSHSYLGYIKTQIQDLASSGALVIPPGQVKSISVPFYSEQPLRPLNDNNVFGTVCYYLASGSMDVFVALPNPNLFFIRPIPVLEGRPDTLEEFSDEGLGCVSPYSSSHKSGCKGPGPHLTCSKHNFDRCCNCYLSMIYQECGQDMDYVRPKFYCQHPKGSNREHLACEFHFLDQICCKCRVLTRTEIDNQLIMGGVEQNPGPARLVYKDRGLYRHYGVQVGDLVLHLDSDNIFETILKGTIYVQQDKSDGWIPCSEYIESIGVDYVKAGALPDFKFSCTDNCETWAKHLLGDYGHTQGNILVQKLVIAVALGFFMTVVLTYENENPLSATISGLMSKLSNLIFGALENEIVRLTIRTITRILCYLILYVHSPNLLTTGVLVGLIALDVTGMELQPSVKVLCTALVEGDFYSFCTAILENVQEVDKQELKETIPAFTNQAKLFTNEGQPKEFNDWSTAAKNVVWWIEGLMKALTWIKDRLFPTNVDEDVQWLTDNEEYIATMCAVGDEHLCLLHTEKSYAISSEAREKHQSLIEMLSHTITRIRGNVKCGQLTTRLQILLNKMHSINFEPEINWSIRPEPLGIWIQGEAGVGKSFLTQLICRRVEKHFKFKTYSHPIGSNHMDGYTNQQIHVFDDFGQNRDEEDYALICNLVSSVPFIVPKADATAKGTPYNGRLVLATTNRNDFTSSKLFCSDALKRRFPIVLQIRPKERFGKNGRLNVEQAMTEKALTAGQVWEYKDGDQWTSLNFEMLVGKIIDQLVDRQSLAEAVNQCPDDIFGPFVRADPLFDFERLDNQITTFQKPAPGRVKKFRSWVSETVKSIKGFLEKNRAWIIALGAIGSLISLASLAIPACRSFAQNLYKGTPGITKLARNFKVVAEKKLAEQQQIVTENQGPVDLKHICQRLVMVKGETPATALAVGGKNVVTYGHDDFSALVYIRDQEVDVKVSNNYKITYDDQPMDLQLLEFKDLDIQFKNIDSMIHGPDYTGDGYLVWKKESEYMILPVSNIKPWYDHRTVQGTESTQVYFYNARTMAGCCGGVLVGVVNGNPKILGIHTSGNGVTGVANRLRPVFNQGKATIISTSDKPLYHQPRKTKLQPSPVFDEPRVGPAVLSNKDQRLVEEVEDVTKRAAGKYCGNTFDPPREVFEAAKAKVMRDFSKVLEEEPAMLFEEAVDSSILPIDWNTSPGLKYLGKSKHQLVDDFRFKQDVFAQLTTPSTYFVTYLKDELRPLEKISAGKTRAIEACNWDYAVAYRMACGNIYRKIYGDNLRLTGVAVGLNPYTHFDTLVDSLHPYNVCCDFSGFDGSLSNTLMEEAVEILAAFSQEPDLVRAIHRPTIYSTNYVSDEVWSVEGGMCSGSPCTSVLNSICNLLAGYTVFSCLGFEPEDLRMVAYGDDNIVSMPYPMELDRVPDYYRWFFGMKVTNFDKTGELSVVSPMEISFLKRKPKYLEGTIKLVGALDLDSMNDHLQYTRSPKDFSQQLDSYCLELALHGKETYLVQTSRLKKLAPTLMIMPWAVAYQRAKNLCLFI